MKKKLFIITGIILFLSLYGVYKYDKSDPYLVPIQTIINETYDKTVELERSSSDKNKFFKELIDTYENELNQINIFSHFTKRSKLKNILNDYSEGLKTRIEAYKIYSDTNLSKDKRLRLFKTLISESNKIIFNNLNKLKDKYFIKISKDYYNMLEYPIDEKAEVSIIKTLGIIIQHYKNYLLL